MQSGLFYYNSFEWSISNSWVFGYFLLLLCFIEISVFNANNIHPDQTSRSVASDLGLYCFPMFLLGDARLEWVKPTAVIQINNAY